MDTKSKMVRILKRTEEELDAVNVCGIRNCHLISLVAGNIQMLIELAERMPDFEDSLESDKPEDDDVRNENTDD